MMLAHPALDTPLCFEKQPVQVLCVENKVLFRDMLCCLFTGNDPARFVLSENLTPLDFAKNAFFLRDLLFPDFSDKTLGKRIDALAETLLHTDTPEALRLFDALAQHGIAFLTIESCAVKRDAGFGLYIIDRDLCCIHENG